MVLLSVVVFLVRSHLALGLLLQSYMKTCLLRKPLIGLCCCQRAFNRPRLLPRGPRRMLLSKTSRTCQGSCRQCRRRHRQLPSRLRLWCTHQPRCSLRRRLSSLRLLLQTVRMLSQWRRRLHSRSHCGILLSAALRALSSRRISRAPWRPASEVVALCARTK